MITIACLGWAAGQVNHPLDSLLSLYRTAKHDTTKVWALMNAGKLFNDRNSDSASLFLRQGLSLAEKTGFELGIVRCKINLARVLFDQSRLDEAIALSASTLPLCEKWNLGIEKVAANNLIANVWNTRGNYWIAIDYYEKALDAMKTAKVPPHFPLVVNNNLAILNNNLRLYDKAIEYAKDSYEKATALEDDMTCANSCEHIGNALLGLNKAEEAYHWFEKAVAFGRKVEYKTLIANCLGILGDLERRKGNLPKSERFYTEGLSMANEASNDYCRMTILHGFGLLAFDRQQFEQSERFCLQSVALARQLKMDYYLASVLLTLSDLALLEKDFTAWDNYRQNYQDIRDTLAGNALVHAVQELETKYETQQKEQKIKQLEQDQELQHLRLQRQRAMTYGAGGFAILLLAGGLLGWRFHRNKELLVEQQMHIQQQTIRQLEQEKQLVTANAVLRGQEEERGRLSRDLHDGLGGMLSGIKQTLFAMKGNQILTENAAYALNHVISDMDRSIGELRHIARNMMPEALVRFGLKDALQDYCDHTRKSTGLDVHFQAYGMEERLPQDVEVILFRIAQELLNNTVKHAQATKSLVQLLRDGNRINLTVEDNGKGLDINQLDKVQGVGWMNIRSRVSYLEGHLDVGSKPGAGVSVSVDFELK
jgi:signal transduction histidine kinase/uncharacterized glyoxalase superfamily protein PhnB